MFDGAYSSFTHFSYSTYSSVNFQVNFVYIYIYNGYFGSIFLLKVYSDEGDR